MTKQAAKATRIPAEVKESPETSPVVLMEDASLDFGGGAGIFGLNIQLKPGTILGLIGPSGCGKTTAIRLINGVYQPTAGEVRVFGMKPAEFRESERSRIGYIPQQFILYPNLSVEENLHFLGSIYGMTPTDRKASIQPLLAFVELAEARKRLGRKLSGGMQRRLMLAGALLHDPELLIADEPTAGIDPILRARIWENFHDLRQQGKSLLVTTQYVGEAAYCDLVAVMRKGRLITIDTPTGLQRQAMGGDVIFMEIQPRRLSKTVRYLEGLSEVRMVERKVDDPGGVYIYVDDAGKELPKLLNQLRDELNLTPQVAEHYLPPFDEVFVRLVQQEPNLEHEKVAL